MPTDSCLSQGCAGRLKLIVDPPAKLLPSSDRPLEKRLPRKRLPAAPDGEVARDVAACGRNQAQQRMPLEHHQVVLRSVVERQEMAICPGPALAGDEAAVCHLVACIGGKADRNIEPTQLVGLDVWEEGVWKPADRDRQVAGIAHLRGGA